MGAWGANEEIAAEFGRAEPANLWRERVYWMAVGVLGAEMTMAFYEMAESALMKQLSGHGFGFNSWLGWGFRSLSIAAFVWLVLRLAGGRVPGWLRPSIERVSRGHLKRWLAALVLCYAGFTAVCSWQFITTDDPASRFHVDLTFVIEVLYNTLWFAAFAMLVLWLSRRRVGERKQA